MRLRDKFKLSKEIEIKVPNNYVSSSILSSSVKRNLVLVGLARPALLDVNFANVTKTLSHGIVYRVEFYDLTEDATFEECLQFIVHCHYRTQLVGAQGLVLLYELAAKELPGQKEILSLDKKENLWLANPEEQKEDKQRFMLPVIHTDSPLLMKDPRIPDNRRWEMEMQGCGEDMGTGCTLVRFVIPIKYKFKGSK